MFTYTEKAKVLMPDTKYLGQITSANYLINNKIPTDKEMEYYKKHQKEIVSEKVIINVSVNGYIVPGPASFNLLSDKGNQLCTDFLAKTEATPDPDIRNVINSLKGKKVNITVVENEVEGKTYLNVMVNAITNNVKDTNSKATNSTTQELKEEDLPM